MRRPGIPVVERHPFRRVPFRCVPSMFDSLEGDFVYEFAHRTEPPTMGLRPQS
jgi:hypothetical protein